MILFVLNYSLWQGLEVEAQRLERERRELEFERRRLEEEKILVATQKKVIKDISVICLLSKLFEVEEILNCPFCFQLHSTGGGASGRTSEIEAGKV